MTDTASADVLTAAAQGRLKSFIERAERLNEDAEAISNDKAELYAEAKGEGFDTKIIKLVVRMRTKDSGALQEEQALVDLYLSAIGGAVASPDDWGLTPPHKAVSLPLPTTGKPPRT